MRAAEDVVETAAWALSHARYLKLHGSDHTSGRGTTRDRNQPGAETDGTPVVVSGNFEDHGLGCFHDLPIWKYGMADPRKGKTDCGEDTGG